VLTNIAPGANIVYPQCYFIASGIFNYSPEIHKLVYYAEYRDDVEPLQQIEMNTVVNVRSPGPKS
jgi:hypothetical protein